MKKILFVDDEPRVLQGLRRLLYPMRNDWDMHFAESAEEGLRVLEESEFDVVVSDIKMPGMDGIEFLGEIKSRYPRIVRIVLSGESNRDAVLKSLGSTHRYLSKPCEPDTLKSIVTSACALRDLLGSDNVRKVVTGMDALPSPSGIGNELTMELSSPDASVVKIGSIIEKDPAITAKMLQMANSAFFGQRQRVSSVGQAVSVLGLDAVRMLVSVAEVFSAFGFDSAGKAEAERLSQHSMRVGAYARQLATKEGLSANALEDSLTAGLLHDIGKLVFAWKYPNDYRKTITLAAEKKISSWEAEMTVLGATHAEVGAYLLGLWGLPETVVTVIAFHHSPSKCCAGPFSPLAAVHLADAFDCDDRGYDMADYIDVDYLEASGFKDRLELWRCVCSPSDEQERRISA